MITVIKRHQQLFRNELVTVTPYKAKLQVQSGAPPRFFKPHPVPFAIRAAAGKELDLLEKQGIIEKLFQSVWAAPIVTVPKKDGRFRICRDYKVTVNQALAVDQHPLSKPDDLLPPWLERNVSKNLISLRLMYRCYWTRSHKTSSPSTRIKGSTAICGSHMAFLLDQSCFRN